MNNDFMDLAFSYAELAYKNDEVPVGAVIVKDKKVISYGFNQKEKNNSVLEHAELIAISNASKVLNNWRLDDCDISVTLDPCPMCASAIKQSRIKNVYSALNNSDDSNIIILKKIFEGDKVNPSVNFISNFNVDKSKQLLSSFFQKQRNK